MGIISVASGSSCWRGLEYYKHNKVENIEEINENEYKSKHIVATYFKAFPDEAVNFEKEQNELEKEYEKEQEELYDKVINYLYKMKKEELISEIINIFDYGPEWIYDDFIRRNYID